MTTTPIVHLRWTVSPRLGLNQQVIFNDGRPTVLLGADPDGHRRVRRGLPGRAPALPAVQPVPEPLNLTARLQLGNYSTSLGTYVREDGAVDYSASGSTFLYMGGLGGIQPQQVGTGGSMGRYVVRGVVRDELGQPVEGAALAVGGEVVFTNSVGEFFVRVRSPRQYDLSVRLEEFLFPGH